jgi:hypothetical protein
MKEDISKKNLPQALGTVLFAFPFDFYDKITYYSNTGNIFAHLYVKLKLP